jgi:hypothetical protein
VESLDCSDITLRKCRDFVYITGGFCVSAILRIFRRKWFRSCIRQSITTRHGNNNRPLTGTTTAMVLVARDFEPAMWETISLFGRLGTR